MYTKICRTLARACMWLGIFGLVAVICAVSWQVFGRYVLNNTPTWAESLALLLVLYVTMLGVAVGVRDAGHIGLESFLVLAPDWLRLKMEFLDPLPDPAVRRRDGLELRLAGRIGLGLHAFPRCGSPKAGNTCRPRSSGVLIVHVLDRTHHRARPRPAKSNPPGAEP